jgi:hypothetical protein
MRAVKQVIVPALVLALAAAATVLTWPVADAAPLEKVGRPPIKLESEKIQLPYGDRLFRGGEAAQVANARCLPCHSKEMIDTQPPLAMAVWKAEVEKMRSAFGCLVPDDQVEKLVQFLYQQNHPAAR